VSTLQALAQQVAASTASPESYLYAPMLDARRMEVYTALYHFDGTEVLAPTPMVLDERSLAEHLAHSQLLCFGNGAAKFRPLVTDSAKVGFLMGIEPSAVAVGTLGQKAYQRQEFRDVAYYEPFYLKEVYTTTPKSKAAF
jgi:tRNA threonylcarbamoyladenosine biosynthesis protein TsaB